jgi:vacuolar-type H+-ATPase subunit I/STV1
MRMYMEDIIKQLENHALYAKKAQKSLSNISKKEMEPNKRLSLLNDEIRNLNNSLEHLLLDTSFKEKINSIINSTKLEVVELEKEAKSAFGRKLAEKIKENGFELEGHYPNLKTSIYTFNVNLNTNKVDIYYGPEFERLETTKADPDIVSSRIAELHRKITQREFDSNSFLADILNAYRLCLVQSNKRFEEEIAVYDILSMYTFLKQETKFKKNPLKKYYTEYTRTFLSYDFFQLKTRKIGEFELRLETATRAETKNKSNFLWIPSVGGKGLGETISRIKFKEVK